MDHTYITKTGESGSMNIAEDVIAAIAFEAIHEVEGVGGFASKSSGGNELRGKHKKSSSKTVKINIEQNEITVEANISVEYGTVIAEVAAAVQNAVATAIESMTGVAVRAVNVTVSGIAFEKNKQA